MALLNEVRVHMNLNKATRMYGTTDKQKFPCCYPEYEEKRPDSTFYADFSVADVFGEKAIQDTFNQCFNEWKGNYEMFTELTMVLNHKLWYWYECGIEDYATLYDKLWKQADAWGNENLKGEALEHFCHVLD